VPHVAVQHGVAAGDGVGHRAPRWAESATRLGDAIHSMRGHAILAPPVHSPIRRIEGVRMIRHAILALTATLLTIAMQAFAAAPAGHLPPPSASSSANRIFLELEKEVIPLQEVRGGAMVGVTEGVGASRRIARVECEPIDLTLSASIAAKLVAPFLDESSKTISGAIVTCGADGVPVRRMRFTNALVDSMTFGKLDASSKSSHALGVRLRAESTDSVAVTGEKPIVMPKDSSKPPLASSFRIEIPGLDGNRVAVVEEFTVQRPPAARGSLARGLVISNIKLAVSSASRAGFESWHRETVLNRASSPKTMTISMLSPDMKTALFTLQGTNTGILALREIPRDGDAALERFEVELFVGQFKVLPPR
jgi:hypothetical protein